MNIYSLIATIAQILSWIIVARLVLAWFPGTFPPGHPVMNLLYRITEPVLAPIRKLVYRGGPFDFSPMIAILFLWMISIVLGTAG